MGYTLFFLVIETLLTITRESLVLLLVVANIHENMQVSYEKTF